MLLLFKFLIYLFFSVNCNHLFMNNIIYCNDFINLQLFISFITNN